MGRENTVKQMKITLFDLINNLGMGLNGWVHKKRSPYYEFVYSWFINTNPDRTYNVLRQ